jgi:hypothetical protein
VLDVCALGFNTRCGSAGISSGMLPFESLTARKQMSHSFWNEALKSYPFSNARTRRGNMVHETLRQALHCDGDAG